MYTYCVVCYCVIVAPYVRSVGHVFAYLYTLDDDSERPMDYETSLLPKVFLYGASWGRGVVWLHYNRLDSACVPHARFEETLTCSIFSFSIVSSSMTVAGIMSGSCSKAISIQFFLGMETHLVVC